MKNTLIALIFGLSCTITLGADDVPAHPYVKIETTEGIVILELDGRQAPITVGHFLGLVDSGFYDGLIFHRVIPGFMAQGGGYTPGLKLKEDDDMIANESGNGLTNIRGTIAMARTGDPHSANSQFFINVDNNANESGNGLTNIRGTIAMARTGDPHSANSQFFINVDNNVRLDPNKNTTGGGWGYTVFGFVIEGMEVVDKIVSVQTGPQGEFRTDVPIVPIIIKKMSRYTFE